MKETASGGAEFRFFFVFSSYHSNAEASTAF